jgi:hypothetical protein
MCLGRQPACCTHSRAQRVIAQQRSNGCAHGINVGRINDDPGFAIADSGPDTTRVTGNNG